MWFGHFLCSLEPQTHITFWKVQFKVRDTKVGVRSSTRHEVFCRKGDSFLLSPLPLPLLCTVILFENLSCTLPSTFSLPGFLILSQLPLCKVITLLVNESSEMSEMSLTPVLAGRVSRVLGWLTGLLLTI